MKLSSEERQERILREIMEHGQASVVDLADMLSTTTETVRKDLTALQERNAVVRHHGFAALPTSYGEATFAEKETAHRKEKAGIARTAFDLIPMESSVVLEASTTNLQLAKLLVMRNDLTVFTNSLSICQTLAKSGNALYMVGGAFRGRSNSCTGSWAEDAIRSINADLAFLGCDGISKDGPTIALQQLAGLNREIIEHSRKAYVLMDTSKLEHTGLYTMAPYRAFDAFIFERPLSVTERALLPKTLQVLPEA